MRIVTAREQYELLKPWRLAFDEDAFWAEHAKTMQHFRDKVDNLRYVTPKPGVSLAVGPDWSGSVPEGHPDRIPGQAAADDIHGYLSHEPDGYVNFVHTNPSMRQMGIGKNLIDHAGIGESAHAVIMTPDGQKFHDRLRGVA